MKFIYYIEVNLLCVSMLTVLLFNTVRLQAHSKIGKLYIHISVLTIVLCISDLFSNISDGGSFRGAILLNWISNAIYLCVLSMISCIWTVYSDHVIRGRKTVNVHLSLVISLAALCVLILSAPLNNLMFTVDCNNIYHRGSLLWLQWGYAGICLILPVISAIRYRKHIHEWSAIAIFSIAPIVCSILQILFYGITVIQAGITFSTLILYVFLQSGEVNASHAKAQLMDQISKTDTLTGIQNRRSYELALNSFPKESTVGAIFCDLNGLKYTNDVYGHKAGDQLLINFVRILKENFPSESLFRISGDEFVILLPVTNSAAFEAKAAAFAGILAANARFAAVGWHTGQADHLLETISAAEQNMYLDKKDYYLKTGRDRRN